jgi:hypothetical protein
MKMRLVLSLILLLGLVLPMMAAETAATTKVKKKKKGEVVHMVAFKFKESTTKDQIKKVETDFKALKKKVPQIVSYDWGLNHSPENLNKGFTHGFLLTFKDKADRDAYLIHPDHKAFGAFVGPLVADVFVLDFTATK